MRTIKSSSHNVHIVRIVMSMCGAHRALQVVSTLSKCKYWFANVSVWVSCTVSFKILANIRRRRLAWIHAFVELKVKTNVECTTPTKCICINSDKTEKMALHYLISLLHSYVIYIFKNNCCTYAIYIGRVFQSLRIQFVSDQFRLYSRRTSVWKMNGQYVRARPVVGNTLRCSV